MVRLKANAWEDATKPSARDASHSTGPNCRSILLNAERLFMACLFIRDYLTANTSTMHHPYNYTRSLLYSYEMKWMKSAQGLHQWLRRDKQRRGQPV